MWSEENVIDDSDLELFRALAVEFLKYDGSQVEALVRAGEWIEVDCDG